MAETQVEERIVQLGTREYSSLDVSAYNFGLSTYVNVCNYTNSNIQVMDHRGDTYTVAPEIITDRTSSKIGLVVVTEWTRSKVHGTSNFKVVKHMRTYLMHELSRRPVYDDISNLVIAHPYADNITHPYKEKITEGFLNSVQSDLMEIMQSPPYNILVNDSTGRLTKLYSIINNNLCVIYVTNHVGEDDVCTVLAKIPSSDGTYTREHVDLEDIRSGTCEYTLNDNKKLFIGVNKAQVLSEFQAYLVSTRPSKSAQVLENEFKEKLKEVEYTYKQEIKRLKNDQLDKEADYRKETNRMQEELDYHRDKQRAEQQRRSDNINSTINVIKFLAVVIPAIMTIVTKIAQVKK